MQLQTAQALMMADLICKWEADSSASGDLNDGFGLFNIAKQKVQHFFLILSLLYIMEYSL